MNTLKSLILIAQTITTFANAYDISACMANHEISTSIHCGLAQGATKTLYCRDPFKKCNGYNVCYDKKKYNRPDQKFSMSDYNKFKLNCSTAERKKCMANIKQENAAAKWQCGKVGEVEYYCIGNNQCNKTTKKCGIIKFINSDPKYSSKSYKTVQAKCQASAKKGANADEAELLKAEEVIIETECLRKIKTTQQHKTPGFCGDEGNIRYFCTGQQQCSKHNLCGSTPEHIQTAQENYSPEYYQLDKEDCTEYAQMEAIEFARRRSVVLKAAEAKAKRIADCKSKIMTEDNNANRYRCGIYGGVKHYCLANNSCSQAGWCGQTAQNRYKAQTKYSPIEYEKEVRICEGFEASAQDED